MENDEAASRDYQALLAEKAAKLEDLLQRKPGQKHYKRSLKAFLEADAKAQKVLLQQLEGSGSAEPSPP